MQMPENKNDFNELPKINNEVSNPVVEPVTEPAQQKIEIPQEYYQKLEQERHEKAMQEQQEAIAEQENKEANQMLSKVAIWTLIFTFIFFISIYSALKFIDLAIFAPVILAIFLSVPASIKDKKESTRHTSILVGGMLTAVVAYVIGMARKDEADFWMHFAIMSAIIAFITYAICAIIHIIIANRESIKALGIIGIILFFAALIGLPYYFYQKNPEEIYKTIFMKTTEVKAETEFEFITKTMKNRYGTDFECQNKKVKTNVQKGRKITERTCVPVKDKDSKVTVKSLTYNEENNQYIVMDNYLDILKLNEYKKSIATNILKSTGTLSVNIFVYPEKNCTFLGDCTECDEYYAHYDDETNPDNQYKNSSTANYEKYTSMSAKDIINDGKYKYIITVVGSFNELADYMSLSNTVLAELNKEGLQNKYGFEITFFTTNDGGVTQKQVYKVKGETADDLTFKNPQAAN